MNCLKNRKINTQNNTRTQLYYTNRKLYMKIKQNIDNTSASLESDPEWNTTRLCNVVCKDLPTEIKFLYLDSHVYLHWRKERLRFQISGWLYVKVLREGQGGYTGRVDTSDMNGTRTCHNSRVVAKLNDQFVCQPADWINSVTMELIMNPIAHLISLETTRDNMWMI